MILWTPLPAELVLDGLDAPPRPAMEVRSGGRLFVLQPITGTQARLVRLVSSDPADYLNPMFQPGRIVTLAPLNL